MTGTTKKLISLGLKTIILVLAFYFIYHQYINKGNSLNNFEHLIANIGQRQVTITLSAVVLMMFANWTLEALKWRYLTRTLANITLWQAIEGVFCGLTWAVITPNRFGEYGGRVMYLPPRRRIHGVFAMAVGAFGQNVITNVLGSSAFVWFIYSFLSLNYWLSLGILLGTVIFVSLFMVLYFNIKWLVWLLDKIPFLKKHHRFFEVMGRYKTHELITVMLFCLARFSIFSMQYYLVIHLLIPALPLYEILLMVFIVFFIQSALPSLDVLDIAVRTYAATTIFAYVTNQQVAVVAAFTSIWLINLIIPAILGMVFTLKLKFFDNNL